MFFFFRTTHSETPITHIAYPNPINTNEIESKFTSSKEENAFQTPWQSLKKPFWVIAGIMTLIPHILLKVDEKNRKTSWLLSFFLWFFLWHSFSIHSKQNYTLARNSRSKKSVQMRQTGNCYPLFLIFFTFPSTKKYHFNLWTMTFSISDCFSRLNVSMKTFPQKSRFLWERIVYPM